MIEEHMGREIFVRAAAIMSALPRRRSEVRTTF